MILDDHQLPFSFRVEWDFEDDLESKNMNQKLKLRLTGLVRRFFVTSITWAAYFNIAMSEAEPSAGLFEIEAWYSKKLAKEENGRMASSMEL